jgi:hypothetical protein
MPIYVNLLRQLYPSRRISCHEVKIPWQFRVKNFAQRSAVPISFSSDKLSRPIPSPLHGRFHPGRIRPHHNRAHFAAAMAKQADIGVEFLQLILDDACYFPIDPVCPAAAQ